MAGKVCHWLGCITAFILLLFTTISAIVLIYEETWWKSNTSPGYPNIGLACAPEQNCAALDYTVSFSWDSLTTTDQKACAGLLVAAACCGSIALFFLTWAVLFFCCAMRVAGLFAGVFAGLQFIAFLSAILVFAGMWDWSVPAEYYMGGAYIVGIICVPVSLLAAVMATADHRMHEKDDYGKA